MSFPYVRHRRLRRSEALRAMVRETSLSPDDFIAPLFVVPGEGVRNPISSLPGQHHLSVDAAVEEASSVWRLGVKSVLLFGIPPSKDEVGSSACAEDGIVQRASRAIKREIPGLSLIADLCFCEYTSHGHCGVVFDGDVDNDATLEALGIQAQSLAKAGVDVVAPSGMMDGMVGAIRESLDEEGYTQTAIMSYAVKYASAYYGPFREAVDSAPAFGDRRTYQMDPANVREALREALSDEEEGADILMVKPALAYLDVIRLVREAVEVPLAAYNVSGEYAMIKSAGERGLIDEQAVMMESLLAIKRSGADLIISYFAQDAARLLA